MLDAIRAGRMHHAWLITGPEGVGKATLAYRFARRLLAGSRPRTRWHSTPPSPVFRRVAANSHADLLTIERVFNEKTKRMKTQIAVEDVRRINGFMSLTPAEGGWRVVVVDGAEELNQNSANALLKILEEPPPRAILLLAVFGPGPAAADHPQPLPPLAPVAAGGWADGSAARPISARNSRPTNAAA